MYENIKAYFYQFVDIDDASWKRYEQLLQPKSIKKGDFLIQPGQVCHSMSFVNSGYFRVYSISHEKEHITNLFFENSFASDDDSFLTQQPSNEYIEALAKCEVLQISFENRLKMIEEVRPFARLLAEKSFAALSQCIVEHCLMKR